MRGLPSSMARSRDPPSHDMRFILTLLLEESNAGGLYDRFIATR